jgi:hypothetical protein
VCLNGKYGFVFIFSFLKLKGADRKHKQDREKILKRPLPEQEKYQPSYECTVLTDVRFITQSVKILYCD